MNVCGRLPCDQGAYRASALPQSIGQDLFGDFACVTPCLGGYECLWQSVYLGPCGAGTRWLWDNSTQHIREASTPRFCLTMCPTQVRHST